MLHLSDPNVGPPVQTHPLTHVHTLLTDLTSCFPAGSPVIVPGHWCLQCQTSVSSDNNAPIFRANSPPTPTPSEGKHKCSCSLVKQPWQNILTRRLLLALLCSVHSGYQGMCLPLLHLRQRPRPFWDSIGWHCVWGGGNNGYYVPNKIYAAALSLQRPVPFCNDCLLSQPS